MSQVTREEMAQTIYQHLLKYPVGQRIDQRGISRADIQDLSLVHDALSRGQEPNIHRLMNILQVAQA